MCCNKKIAKCILIVLNTIFFILGAGCLVAGILIVLDKSVLTSVLSKVPNAGDTLDQALQYSGMLENVAYVIIGVGAVIFFIGFCGCFGAIKEVKCLLIVYSIVVFLILAAQIAAAVLGFLYKATVIAYMRQFLNTTIAEKYEGLTIKNGALSESLEPYTAAWDIAQITLECCGNYDSTDFYNYATKWNKTYSYSGASITNAKVPIACCKTTDKTALISDMANFAKYFTNTTQCLINADPLYTNTENCYDKIVYYIDTYTLIVIGVAIGVACVELLAIICACCLMRSVGKDD